MSWSGAGLFIAYLGSSLLLARMSAEAAKVRYDSNLLWTNKLDRCSTLTHQSSAQSQSIGQATLTYFLRQLQASDFS